MTTDSFAAAQQRIAARHHSRLAEIQRAAGIRQQRRLSIRSKIHVPGVGLGLSVWDWLKDGEGTRPAFRVGQVDAELLDEELLDLLKNQIGEGLKLFGVCITLVQLWQILMEKSTLIQDWSSEVLLILRAILFKLSIWDHNASYGASLQGMEYRRIDGSKPFTWQKAIYGLVTVGGRYGWSKWEQQLIDKNNVWSRITNFASSAHDIAAFASFMIFLVNGRYRTLLDRALRLRLVVPSNQIRREVSFEYLNRQLVWHAFTEFLLFLLPLMGINRWRRLLSKAWRKAKSLTSDEDERGELSFLPERTCPICYQEQNPTSAEQAMSMTGGISGSAETDITNPYESDCGCKYCYVCLASRLADGEGFNCLRCGELIKECRPWSGDVVEAKKTVTFQSDNSVDQLDDE